MGRHVKGLTIDTFTLLRRIFTGVIRNTEPLDYEKNHNHILQVVAFDCGMKRSEPVLVSVKVNRVCRLGWTGTFQLSSICAFAKRQKKKKRLNNFAFFFFKYFF